MESDQVRLIEGTNTQTRNLTVLTSILTLLNKDVIPLRLLELKAKEWDKKTAESSSTYRNRSGRVTDKAFKYYVNLTEDLGLVTRYNEIVRSSRDGLIYCLSSKTIEHKLTPGKLLFFEKIFFVYILLNKDADNLIPILEIISNNNGLREAEIRKAFKEKIIQRFQKKALSTNLKTRIEAEKKYRDLKLSSLSPGKHTLKHHIPNRLVQL